MWVGVFGQTPRTALAVRLRWSFARKDYRELRYLAYLANLGYDLVKRTELYSVTNLFAVTQRSVGIFFTSPEEKSWLL